MGRFLKFAVVGTIGFVVNTVGLVLGVRIGFRPSVAGPVGAEFAILSNFILNNIWTFSDRSLGSVEIIVPKFIQFNILSLGSVVIQFISLKIGELIFGLVKYKKPLIDTPWVRKFPGVSFALSFPIVEKFSQKISLYFLFYVFGVGVGLIVNYIIYNTIIWRNS